MTSPEGPADRSRPRFVMPVLVGALVFTTALAATFALLWRAEAGVGADDVSAYLSRRRPAAEETARRVVDLLVNYDSTNLDDRADQIRRLATGSFRDQYDDLLSQGLPEALEEASISSRGQILEGPEIAFTAPSEALAIARVTQTTQSTENPGGRTFEYVLRIGLVEAAGSGWKASTVEIVSERTG